MMVQTKCHGQNPGAKSFWRYGLTVKSKYGANNYKSANIACYDLETLLYVIQDLSSLRDGSLYEMLK